VNRNEKASTRSYPSPPASFSATARPPKGSAMFDFNDVPPENTIVVPADEVSAQWGKFPPGMTAAPWQADWCYITGNKKEAEHIESFGLPAVCHKGLGPEHLRGADVALLNCDGAALVDMLASIVRQLRVLNVPNLASCIKEQFI